MPGGLRDVSQRFDADASGYIEGLRRMIDQNRQLIESVRDVVKQTEEIRRVTTDDSGWRRMAASLDETSRTIREYRGIIAEAYAANQQFNESQIQTEKLSREGRDALRSLSDEYRRHGETVAQAKQAQAIFRDGLIDQANSSRDAVVAMSDHEQAVARLAKTYGTAQETFAKADFSKPLEYTVANMETLRQTLRDTVTDMDGAVRHMSTLGAVASGMAPSSSGGGYAAGGIWGPLGAAAAGAAAGGGGSGGGGGRGRWSAASYVSAGGGDMFPAGTAGHDASAIIGFAKRWWTPVHFAIMGVNELMATLLPAAAAAGAATLVGWQGVEQMIPRFQAINNTAEALGGAYGITSGQYLGTGNAIQRYQNLATGGVYELGGAGINLMRMGAGTFGQTGLNTIAMLDRGFANMQVNMQQRGTMGLLGGLAGKGTDYLRQLGDIGANFGNIFLGLAPHLPGVGEDYLGTLEGATGGFAGLLQFMNQHKMGDMIGAVMAGEAGWRVGKPVVGLAGRGLMGLGGIAERLGLGSRAMGADAIAELAASSGVDASLIDAGGFGLAGGLEGAGIGLGMLGGPAVAGLALSAFLGSKLVSSMPTGAMRQVSGLQAGIGQAGFSAAFRPLAQAIVKTTGLAGTSGAGLAAQRQVETPFEIGRFGPGITPTYAQTYAAAATGFAQTTGDLVNAGPQLVAALKKAGLRSVSMADAFQIAQNALLDTTHAFGKDGKLNKTAVQMVENYAAAIAPMTRSGGAFNAAIGAQQIMSSPAMQDLSKINQAMDSMTQIMTGGPAGMATLFGMLGGSPTTVSHGGMKLQAPPAVQAMAKALTSFTSAGGASAWNTFAGSQGFVAAEQQNLDQLRTYMTLGALGPQGAAGIAGFQLQQLLPMARKSPAALAMLMQQGQQMGIGGYYDPSRSQAANFQAFQKALGGSAFDSKQLTQAMNQAVIKSSDIPAMASQFVQGVSANIQSKQVAQAAQDVMRLRQAAAGGTVATGAGRDLASVFQAQGLHGGALTSSIDAALKQAGVSRTMRIQIEAQVNTAQVKAQLAGIKSVAPVNVQVHANGVATASQQIQGIKGKNVMITASASGVGAAQAAINSVHGKVVDIVVNTIVTGGSVSQSAMRAAGYAPGVSASTIAAGIRKSSMGMQTGGMVPGSGSGDIIPAMLEPGEAIIPRYLVPLIAPILAAHRVPGFGGVPQSSASHFAAGGVAGGGPITGNVGRQFAYTLVDEITKALKDSGAKNIAQALVNKIGQEVSYAKQTASGITSGLNLAGMDLTQGSVLGQMQNYAASSAAFAKDLATLRKQHLAKGLISQIVGAGPVQGDLLAQSILGTGVKGVNAVWGQIGHSANAIGAQAAMAQFGNTLAPNLRSASITQNHVTVNIQAKGGTTLALTPAQVKQLVEQFQAALLKQARRNQKTGIQLSGKGA